MNLILCVGNGYSLSFNNRRLSKDRAVYERIDLLKEDAALWMDNYTYKSFSRYQPKEAPIISDACLIDAPTGSYVLCDKLDVSLGKIIERIESLYIFQWNRDYPFDKAIDLTQLSSWERKVISEFKGFSHERITLEQWRKNP